MGMIEEAIKNYWGERCPDHDADCVVCQAWKEFDTIEYVHKPMSKDELAKVNKSNPATCGTQEKNYEHDDRSER